MCAFVCDEGFHCVFHVLLHTLDNAWYQCISKLDGTARMCESIIKFVLRGIAFSLVVFETGRSPRKLFVILAVSFAHISIAKVCCHSMVLEFFASLLVFTHAQRCHSTHFSAHLTCRKTEKERLHFWSYIGMSCLFDFFLSLLSLTTLLLADNQLADDVHLLCTPASSTLTSLSLQNNRISLWTTLYQFSPLFPALKSLRLRGNPMTPVFKIPMSTESLRPACIACMPALHHLNGSAITGKERDSSERWYIGVCHTALLQEKSAFKEVFYDHHPQLATLEEKHGRPFCAQTQCVANMVTIHVAADGHISRELQVPLSMTVTQLRALGRKLFGKVYSAIDLVDDEVRMIYSALSSFIFRLPLGHERCLSAHAGHAHFECRLYHV